MILRAGILSLLILGLAPFAALGQSPNETDQAEPPAKEKEAEPATAIFNHPASSRFWISGQANIILQGHPAFRARYSGVNSLQASGERAMSRLLTFYTGVQLSKTTEIIFDVESAGGRGISDALGLAGFTNLDVVRNPQLGAKPYVARAMIRQIIPLGRATGEATRGPLSLATELPVRRLEWRAGKFSMADFFDVNAVGSDSHLQFMNWTIDNNGAYDYAADTRGYTYGFAIEYQDRRWGVRFAEALMPKVANGIQFDWNVRRSRAENLEFEIRHAWIPHRAGVVRILTYVNHANMGRYRAAIDNFLAGREPVPDIEAHRRPGRVKYGFGFNAEQAVTDRMRVFARWGWNEGRYESFAYTEVNRSVAAGADWKGDGWRRPQDRVGLALVVNGLSGDHRRYLALGGHGFLLGDGALTYGPERIVEGYYTFHIWRGVSAAVDLQHITHPGYNRDRGPVWVPALRLHVDF